MRLKNKRVFIHLFILCFMLTQIFGGTAVFAASQDRLSGDDRYETAVEISQEGWADGSDYAILARGDDFADALCAGPLAYMYDAPILLTQTDNLNSDTLKELERLGVDEVIIVGGYVAVSKDVEEELEAEGFEVSRIKGDNRYETSAKVAEEIDNVDSIVVATGSDFPDALSISPIAARLGMPILLTAKNSLPEDVEDYIDGLDIDTTYVIGGTNAISNSVKGLLPNAKRLSGTDRYKTNVEVMEEFEDELNFDQVYVAVGDGPRGDEFADALTGAVLAAKNNSPLALVYKALPDDIEEYMASVMSADVEVIALGGYKAVSDRVIDNLLDSIDYAEVLEDVNLADDGEEMRDALEDNAYELGISVSYRSDYGKLESARKNSVAQDVYDNMPRGGYKSLSHLQRVFNRLIESRVIIGEQLDRFNDASDSLRDLEELGCDFVTVVREDLEDAKYIYDYINGEDIDWVIAGLEEAEDEFDNLTSAEMEELYRDMRYEKFDGYGELLRAIRDAARSL